MGEDKYVIDTVMIPCSLWELSSRCEELYQLSAKSRLRLYRKICHCLQSVSR